MMNHLPGIKEDYIMKKVEYKMPKSMYDALLKTRSKEDEKVKPRTYVINLINEQYRLLRKVTHLFVEQ